MNITRGAEMNFLCFVYYIEISKTVSRSVFLPSTNIAFLGNINNDATFSVENRVAISTISPHFIID